MNKLAKFHNTVENYSADDLEIDTSRGFTLNEVCEYLGEEKFKVLLKEYKKYVSELDLCDMDEMSDFLFYEDEDREVLKKFGFEELIDEEH